MCVYVCFPRAVCGHDCIGADTNLVVFQIVCREQEESVCMCADRAPIGFQCSCSMLDVSDATMAVLFGFNSIVDSSG